MTRRALETTRGRLTLLGVAVAVLLACSLTAAGCGGDDPESGPGSQGTAAGATLPGRWPLTGEPANGPAPGHPVLVVKVDNSTSSHPQLGLGKADLVTEELVEGGATRLAVFYYSKLPARVGPVRSIRPPTSAS